MSTKPPADAPVKESSTNRYSRQIDDAFEEASRLAGSSLPPTDFYQRFLEKALNAIDAPAGAVWLRTPQGFLQIACQKDLDKVGLDTKRGGRQCHNEILRQVFQAQPARPCMVEPQGRLSNMGEPGPVPAANLTEYYALFAPIVNQEKQSFGLLEIFQEASHDPRMYPTFLNYAVQMAGYASQYHQFSNSRQAAGLDKVYAQVESFARLIHGTLNPTECAYHIANEGRRLIEADRLCVGVRHGKKVTVEAVSGADVVEKASTHVRRMRALFDAVIKWGDKLVFKGEKDESLPPQVLRALDDYLAESQPKLLVVVPIRDEREKDDTKPARSVLLLESFNPPEDPAPLLQRLEIVGKHAAPALYNAAEMKKIPLKPLWWPILKVQEGLGGKARFFTFLAIAATALLTTAMILVPAPLKKEAKGQLEPIHTRVVYGPDEGQLNRIAYNPGDRMDPGSAVIEFYSDKRADRLRQLNADLAKQRAVIDAIASESGSATPSDGNNANIQKAQAKAAVESLLQQIRGEEEQFNLDLNAPGKFYAKAPQFDSSSVPVGARWTMLNADNREQLLRRTVKPTDPLLRLGYVEGPWHITLKIPQRNIGHVMKAFADSKLHKLEGDRKFLDVDLLLTNDSDAKRSGRLYLDQIAADAVPNRDDHNESEPVIMAKVAINLDDFPEGRKIPRELFVTGQEVHCRIRCGDHSLGYSTFHGVWEWFYEKVIFFF